MHPYIPHYVFEAPPPPDMVVLSTFPVESEATPQRTKRTLTYKLSIVLASIGILALIVSYGPSVYYTLKGSGRISNLLWMTAQGKELPAEKKYSYQPQFDRNLSEINMISIPAIGVSTTIEEATNENHEEALERGVWRVNDFATPYNREEGPTILAAHRFGYLSWSLNFRLHNSFYNLPHLKEGDTVEIVWRQRKYTYGVYKTQETTEISDYNADLILYTCLDLSSDIRYIVYAKLLEV